MKRGLCTKMLTFKAFIDRTAPLYLCELIEQQNSSTNIRLENDASLLKLPPPIVNLCFSSGVFPTPVSPPSFFL